MSALLGVLLLIVIVGVVAGLPIFAVAVLLMPSSVAQAWTRRGRS